MCLSTIYVDRDPAPIGKNICKIQMDGDTLLAVDIMGREIRLPGTIEEIDLVENTIRVRRTPAS